MGQLALSRADRLLLGIVLVTAVFGALVTWLILPPEKVGANRKTPLHVLQRRLWHEGRL